MNATVENYCDTIYRLRMNKKTRTIKIDVYYKIDSKNFRYYHTLICNSMDKQDFYYYYNNNMTFNDVRHLAKTADSCCEDYQGYKFKY